MEIPFAIIAAAAALCPIVSIGSEKRTSIICHLPLRNTSMIPGGFFMNIIHTA